jgi:hypothetical protein
MKTLESRVIVGYRISAKDLLKMAKDNGFEVSEEVMAMSSYETTRQCRWYWGMLHARFDWGSSDPTTSMTVAPLYYPHGIEDYEWYVTYAKENRIDYNHPCYLVHKYSTISPETIWDTTVALIASNICKNVLK